MLIKQGVFFLLEIKMRLNKKALGLTGLALIILMVPLVLANGVPPPELGYSPGYWKHQLKAHYNGRGHMQESWEDMLYYEEYIDMWIDTGDIEYLDGTAGFTLYDAYLAFNDPSWNHMWTTIANWFNEAAGLAPYTDSD